ncbi:universal stress protein [Halomicroarcula sp. S1AR25-4]|uniref:universal stress protein n=1 Tax=Haloarcula sp. S1AR25-4 TaxID=2950538 RepID=UPI00287542EE|nr:universal stress protein [Halomicroarcula sp. S1AR25-4]MDS0278729.1 universal stress protein [Halomicroarcula sp. S1AR25-4]
MTLVVPFDGSELAEAALVRATEFGNVFDEDVLAVSVIPAGKADYAREHGWIEQDEAFDMASVVATLHEQVTELCPSADFRHKVVDRYAPSGTIAKHLRRVAREEDASMVFIGSENAGHLVTGVSSVGGTVAADESYDVVIVRHRSPAKIAKLKNASPYKKSKSDFYIPE